MTITLRRDVEYDCWTATCDEYRRLFGTATLPTAFRADADADMVLDVVQARNMMHRVTVEE